MKKYIFNSITAIIIMAFVLTGCKSKNGKDGITDNNIKFETIKVDKKYHLFGNAENPACDLTIKFTYPSKYENQEILKKIQQEFILTYFGEYLEELTPEVATTRYTEEYLQNYKSLEDDFREEVERDADSPIESWFSYYETSYNEIAYNRNNLISYTIHFESYTGGAHGAHSLTNHVINLATGEPLTEEDIFIDNYQDQLAEILVDEIAKENDAEEPKELENMGFFSIEEIYPNGNFLVDESGITYDFNEYEIAAYAVGITKVHLPYERIQHLLRKNSPISNLFN